MGYTQTTLQQVIAGIKAEMPQLPDLDVLKAIKSALEEMKRPRGQGWQTNTYSWDSPGLQEWIKQGGSYGIVAGSAWEYEGRPVKLFILDADNTQALAQTGFQDDLPKDTLRVKTGRADPPGHHVYFISDISSSKAHYELPGICHFKFYASQCVGPNSLHPSGQRYELVDDRLPAYVDADTLARAIITTTQALSPAKVKDVRDMFGVKVTPRGMSNTEKTAKLEAVVRDAKLARIKKIQQQEAATEEAYKAFKATKAAPDSLQAVSNENGALKVELGDILLDEKINPCLRKLTAALAQRQVVRFEQAIAYEGKRGEGEHALRLAWATALVKAGYDDDQIQALCQNFDDYNESRTQQQLASVRGYVAQGGDYHPCATLRSYIPAAWCQGCRWVPPNGDGSDDAADRHGGAVEGITRNNAESAGYPDGVVKAGDNILRRGKVLKFLLQQFHKNHVGDDVAGKVLILSYVSGSSLTGNGIQPGISGDAQTGKSDAMDAALHILPQDRVMKTGLSDKAAAYIEFEPGQVVHSDDLKWTEGLVYMLKIAMSHFQQGATYTTVMKVGGRLKAVPLTIPPRLLWWITGADAAPDDQIESRQYPVDVDQNAGHALEVRAAIARRRAGRKPKFYVDRGILTARYILDQIRHAGPFNVQIPYAEWVDYRAPADYRGQQQFFDLIDALAILRFKQRQVVDGWVQADLQDFYEAKAIFCAKNESHITGLTKAELQIIATMTTRFEWTQADLVEALGKSQSTISKRLDSIMGKTAYVTRSRDRNIGEYVYRLNKVDLGIFGNVIVGWKKDIPVAPTLTPAPLFHRYSSIFKPYSYVIPMLFHTKNDNSRLKTNMNIQNGRDEYRAESEDGPIDELPKEHIPSCAEKGNKYPENTPTAIENAREYQVNNIGINGGISPGRQVQPTGAYTATDSDSVHIQDMNKGMNKHMNNSGDGLNIGPHPRRDMPTPSSEAVKNRPDGA